MCSDQFSAVMQRETKYRCYCHNWIFSCAQDNGDRDNLVQICHNSS